MPAAFRLALAAAVVALAGTARTEAAPVQPGGANVTLPYPAKAPLVLHVKGVEQVKDRLGKMLQALPPAEAKQAVGGIDAGLKALLAGRKLDAVPKDGRVFVVVHDFPTLLEDEPAVAVLVPVTGYKAFKESFLTADERKSAEDAGKGVQSIKSAALGDERTVYLTELKDHVALTVRKETAEVYAGKYTPAQSGALGADLSGTFLAADVSLLVNMDVINDLYGDQIRQFKGLIDFALGQAEMGGMLPGLDKKQLDLVKKMLNGLVQGIEDSRGIVLAVEFRPEGLNLRGQVRFADDTTTSALLAGEKPTTLVEVSKMPRGFNSYGGSHFGKKVEDLMGKFTQNFLAGDDDEKGAAQIEKALAELTAAGHTGETSATTSPDTSLTVSTYTNPAKAAAAQVKLYQAMGAGGKFASIVLKNKPKVADAALDHRGFKLAEVTLTFDFARSVENLPEQVRESTLNQFKKLMKEKTTFWIGTDGKVVVQVMAKDQDAAKKVLDDYLDGKTTVGSDPGFQLTRKNLPADATLMFVTETGQALTMLVDQAKAAMSAIPGGAGIPLGGSVKPVKGEPTYIGVALTLKPQVGTADLFIPGTAMNVAVKMLTPVFRPIE